jgi:DNA primase
MEPRLRKIELDLANHRADSEGDPISLIKERSELQRQLRQPVGLPGVVA